jgi:hypothetical protein
LRQARTLCTNILESTKPYYDKAQKLYDDCSPLVAKKALEAGALVKQCLKQSEPFVQSLVEQASKRFDEAIEYSLTPECWDRIATVLAKVMALAGFSAWTITYWALKITILGTCLLVNHIASQYAEQEACASSRVHCRTG